MLSVILWVSPSRIDVKSDLLNLSPILLRGACPLSGSMKLSGSVRRSEFWRHWQEVLIFVDSEAHDEYPWDM